MSGAALQKGFTALLEGLDDTQLDVPDAAQAARLPALGSHPPGLSVVRVVVVAPEGWHLTHPPPPTPPHTPHPTQLSLFLARAVVDDVLPPAFVRAARGRWPAGSAARHAAAAARALLAAPAPAAAAAAAWADRAAGSLAGAKAAVARILSEYWAAGGGLAGRSAAAGGAAAAVVAEAAAALRALHAPFFMHEPAARLVLAACESPGREAGALALLGACLSQARARLAHARLDAFFAQMTRALHMRSIPSPN